MALRSPSKVYVGLASPPLIAGTEPQLLMLNIGFYLFVLTSFKAWWWLAISWVIHQAMKSMSKSDPFTRGIYLVYQRQADRYEPYPEAQPRRRLRPLKFGRGVVG